MSMTPAVKRILWTLSAVISATAFAGCSDDTVVYEEKPPYNPPADSAAGFLGYYDIAPKQTTCGNCHSGHQAAWKETKHGKAWATLQAAAGKQASCEGCHTISGNGNALSGTPAGYTKVKDSTYHDVQCESCHGSGLKHVEGVGNATIIRPLARVGMTGKGHCGDCHSGTHHPYTEEWQQSGHAVLNTSRATNPSCWGCHEGKHALAKWGVDANYAERDDAATNLPPSTCGVCHNPHGSSYTASLRWPVSSTDPQVNLCMKCHLNRAEPTTSSSTSPHAPQGGVLLGDAGWRPPGFVYDTARIFGSHATDKNPKLCAGCHVGRFTVNDTAGKFTFQATGHLFRPVPCLDANGKPTSSKTCAYTTTARSWQTCAASGCHASADVALNAFNTVRSRMKFYTDQLWIDSNASGSLQASPLDAGLLPTLRLSKPLEWNSSDNMISPAEGAEFNARLCGEYNQSNSDNSKGVHNPFLCEALLIATINYVKSHYGLPAASSAGKLHGPIGGEFSGSMHVSRSEPK